MTFLMTARAGGYGPIDKLLHWLVFALLVVQYIVAFTMPEIRRGQEPETLINLHLSFGMLILAVMLARLAWRLRHPGASDLTALPPWQQTAARASHRLFYVLLLVLPLLGWAAASARGWQVSVFGVVTLPSLVAAKSKIGHLAGDVHTALSWILLGLIGLHVAAAVYHHRVLRDRVLQRMLPGRVT